MRSWSWQTAWRTCASCAARSALVLSSISATMSSLNTFSPEQSTAISTPSLLAMKGRPFTGILWCFYFSILFMVSISWSNYNSSKFQWSDKFINWNVQKMLVLLRLCPVVLGLVKIRFLRKARLWISLQLWRQSPSPAFSETVNGGQHKYISYTLFKKFSGFCYTVVTTR